MGVTGLWRLLEPAGKPVPLETLEGKILAVDISIWLHQMIKGFQDAQGAPLPNAHLLGLFQRLCKLLYYRIRPVFVFDGGVPTLKKQTIAKRQMNKAKFKSSSEKLRDQLVNLLGTHSAINVVLSNKALSPKKGSPRKLGSLQNRSNDDELFKLPPMQPDQEGNETDSDEVSSTSEESDNSKISNMDLHTVNFESDSFQKLPLREKYDLLTELKETRKQNSWGRLNELPSESDSFSGYQMSRLLKRRKLQMCIEETEKEMGGDYLSINEMEKLLNEEGISTTLQDFSNRRVASNENTRFLFIKDVKQAITEAKRQNDTKSTILNEIQSTTVCTPELDHFDSISSKNVEELDEDLERAIKMSLEDVTHEDINVIHDDCVNPNESSSDVEYDNVTTKEMTLAKTYMVENSDLTEKEIDKILRKRNKSKEKKKQKIFSNNDDILMLEASKSNDVFVTDTVNICISPKESERKNENQINANISAVDLSDKSDSSSENDDFEEVGECSAIKPVVQLNLQYDENVTHLQDDIFADIFNNTDKKNIDKIVCDNINLGSDNKKLKLGIKSKSKDIAINNDKEEQAVTESVMDAKDKDDIVSDIFKSTDKNEVKLNITNKKYNAYDAEIKTPQQTFLSQEKINSEVMPKPKDVSMKTLIDQEEQRAYEYVKTVNDKQFTAVIDVEKSDIEKSIISKNYDNDLKEKSNNECIENKDPKSHSSPNIPMDYHGENNDVESDENFETDELVSDSDPTIPLSLPSLNVKEIQSEQKENTSIPRNVEELKSMASDIEKQHDQLMKEYGKMDRMSRNISEEMTKDAQELLSLFGVPYIVSPMEAEAQCAFLELENLSQGTITDDSDIWLFGGHTVYKNFFDQRKHVLQFLSQNIEKLFNLSRENLILLALLVGSDYTVGLSGVGPVTALEILAEFPSRPTSSSSQASSSSHMNLLGGLVEFKRWLRARKIGTTSLRNKLKNVSISDDFPNFNVVQAYLKPEVDTNKEKFTWGTPDVTALREFTRTKFGWSQSKTDEILNPVLKRLNINFSQRSIQSFFKTNCKTLSEGDEKLSKRVKSAIERIGKDPNEIVVESEYFNQNEMRSKKTSKIRSKKMEQKKDEGNKQDTNTKEIEIDDTLEHVALDLITINNPGTSSSAQAVIEKPVASKKRQRNVQKIVIPSVSNINKNEVEKQIFEKLHKKDLIPQREKDKEALLKNKLRAVELFRKSKLGPDRLKRKKRRINTPKEDAGLSESSDSN